jgi:hypothetical protein
MRRCCLVFLLLVLPLPGMAAPPARNDGDLYVLGIALDQEPDAASHETIDSYNWCAEEIDKIFRENSASLFHHLHSRLVLGKEATHAHVLEGLAWLHKSATEKDLVVMYVGAHGGTDPKEGWSFNGADGQAITGHEIKKELGRLSCQVLFLVETCGCGGFARSHKKDGPLPTNVTAICSCGPQQCTDNHLDIAVAEALCGRADFNKDGTIELGELVRYVEERYKEWEPADKKKAASERPVIVPAKEAPLTLPLTTVSPYLIAVAVEGQWYSALLLKHQGNTYRVHLLGWSSKPGPYFLTDKVTRDHVCLATDGTPVMVEQRGEWYPARLVDKEGKRYKVRFVGYEEDELVAARHVQFTFATEPEEEPPGGKVRP